MSAVALRLEPLGHLAVWTGLYVAGATASLALIAGVDHFGARHTDHLALLCALATGVSVYLTDRVKLTDRQLDPADREAHPDRFAYLWPKRRPLRIVAGASALIGMVAAWQLSPVISLTVLGAHVGLFAYAGLPPAPDRAPRRLKDLLVIKNISVAGSVVVFGLVLLLGARLDEWRSDWLDAAARLWRPVLLLSVIVTADAILCDLDDISSDRRFGTRTIPGRLNPARVWTIASILHVVAGVGVLAQASAPAIVFSLGLPLTTLALAMARPRRVRDLVDARLPLLATIGLALSLLG